MTNTVRVAEQVRVAARVGVAEQVAEQKGGGAGWLGRGLTGMAFILSRRAVSSPSPPVPPVSRGPGDSLPCCCLVLAAACMERPDMYSELWQHTQRAWFEVWLEVQWAGGWEPGKVVGRPGETLLVFALPTL